MSILASLALQEEQLCRYADSLTGPLEAQNHQLQANGVFAAHKRLHQQYLAAHQAATSGPERLELLKRLAFLNWYAELEPSFLTGINELDAAAVAAAYALLNVCIREQRLDAELHWMLSYYSSWDYLLLHHATDKLPALTAFVQGVDHSVVHIPRQQLPPGSMANRGQMGLYWQRLGVEQE